MKNIVNTYFPNSYQESRQRFITWMEPIRSVWPNAQIKSKEIMDKAGLTMDWIRADSQGPHQNLILITAALHGVEGFVGSAMQKVFVDEYLPKLDPGSTGIVLVHAINPWGMSHNRRVNANNVDLNRNYMSSPSIFLEEINSDYYELDSLLNPTRLIRNLPSETVSFLFSVIKKMTSSGVKQLRNAIMQGQNSFPRGLYYCGKDYQPESRIMMALIDALFREYKSIIHIDLHTGYGPRYQMSMVNSPNEPRTSGELEEFFKYPLVFRADPEQFYQMNGDMINWVYLMQKDHFPQVDFYGTAFEFGTYGDGVLDEIASLRTTLFENQAHFHGTRSDHVAQQVKDLFLEMYFPVELQWREKALDDCRQGYEGVFGAHRMI
jgi:hypothetical protein